MSWFDWVAVTLGVGSGILALWRTLAHVRQLRREAAELPNRSTIVLENLSNQVEYRTMRLIVDGQVVGVNHDHVVFDGHLENPFLTAAAPVDRTRRLRAFVAGMSYMYGNLGFERKRRPTLEEELAAVYHEIGEVSFRTLVRARPQRPDFYRGPFPFGISHADREDEL